MASALTLDERIRALDLEALLTDDERASFDEARGTVRAERIDWPGGRSARVAGCYGTIFESDGPLLIVFLRDFGRSYREVVASLQDSAHAWSLRVFKLRSDVWVASPFIHESDTRIRTKTEPEFVPVPHRVLVVGRVGVGKSCIGNLLVGRDAFAEADYSVATTREVSPLTTSADGTVGVIDTLGFADATFSPASQAAMLRQLAQVVERCPHGFGLLLFVFDGRVTRGDMKVFDWLTQVIFPESLAHVRLVRNRFRLAADAASVQKDCEILRAAKGGGALARSLAPGILCTCRA